MAFKPVTLISPRGNEYVTDNAVDFNNLTNKGYKVKAQPKPAVPSVPSVLKSDK